MSIHLELEQAPGLFKNQVGFGEPTDILRAHLMPRIENSVHQKTQSEPEKKEIAPRHWILEAWLRVEDALGITPHAVGRLRNKFVDQVDSE